MSRLIKISTAPNAILWLLYVSVASLLSLCAIACSGNADRLSTADSLIDENPDSALTLLQTIRLSARSETALWNLLYTKAAVKTHLTIGNDSLMMYAVDYFDGRNDSLETQSKYYLANINYNQDNYAGAIIYAEEAEASARSLNDYFYLAMSQRLLGFCYEEIYSFDKAIHYYKLAKQNFSKASKSTHEAWMHVFLANALSLANKPAEAIPYLDSIRNVEIGSSLHKAMVKAKALSYFNLQQNDSVESIYKSLEMDGMENRDWWLLAMNSAGWKDSLLEGYIAMADSTAETKIDSLRVMQIQAFKYRADGNLDAAFLTLKTSSDSVLSLYNSILTNPYMIAVSDFHRKLAVKNEKERDMAQTRKTQWVIITLLCVLCLVMTLLYLKGRIRAHESIIKEKNLSLAESKKYIDALLGELTSTRSSAEITTCYHIQLISKLCKEWVNFTGANLRPSDKVIAKNIESIINGFTSDERIAELEDIVNRRYENVLIGLANTYGENLSTTHYRILLFSILDMSIESIQMLLNLKSANNAYVIKHRIKDFLIKHPTDIGNRVIALVWGRDIKC